MKRFNHLLMSALLAVTLSLALASCNKQEPQTPSETENPSTPQQPEVKEVNELPLLTEAVYTHPINYTKIDSYEEKLGRQPKDIKVGSTTYQGYYNADFKHILGSLYDVYDKQNNKYIVYAFCADDTNDDITEIQKWMKDAGFEELQSEGQKGTDKYVRVWSKGDVEVNMRNFPITELKTKSLMLFRFPAKGIEPAGSKINKEHDIITSVKDFPSWDALLTQNNDEVIKFENELGLRTKETPKREGHLYFVTTDANKAKSNIASVTYVMQSQYGIMLYGVLNCIEKEADLQSDAFKQYLKNNGIEGDNWQYFKYSTGWPAAKLVTDKFTFVAYIDLEVKEAIFQLTANPK